MKNIVLIAGRHLCILGIGLLLITLLVDDEYLEACLFSGSLSLGFGGVLLGISLKEKVIEFLGIVLIAICFRGIINDFLIELVLMMLIGSLAGMLVVSMENEEE